MTFVAGALEHERPFPGPLCRFIMSLHPRNSMRLVPACVKFFLSHLAGKQIGICRHYPCAAEIHSWDTAPRVDAQASEGRSGVGGWAPVRNTEGFRHGQLRADTKGLAVEIRDRRPTISHNIDPGSPWKLWLHLLVSSYSSATKTPRKDGPTCRLFRRGPTIEGTGRH